MIPCYFLVLFRQEPAGPAHPHLFEHEDTVPRADELRQLCDASLVEVRPRETAVIEVDFGAAVFPVPLACVWTYEDKNQRTEHVKCVDAFMRPENTPLTCL